MLRIGLLIFATACGSVEPRLDCDEPFRGDLQGYCILGENDGAITAGRDVDTCADPPSEPLNVARGPGGCTDPSSAVLEAEQAAYVRCWSEAYADALPDVDTSDTGPCVVATAGPDPLP